MYVKLLLRGQIDTTFLSQVKKLVDQVKAKARVLVAAEIALHIVFFTHQMRQQYTS